MDWIIEELIKLTLGDKRLNHRIPSHWGQA